MKSEKKIHWHASQRKFYVLLDHCLRFSVAIAILVLWRDLLTPRFLQYSLFWPLKDSPLEHIRWNTRLCN